MKYSNILGGYLSFFIASLARVEGELYTSTAAMSNWASTRKEILDNFKGKIQTYERRLSKLNLAYEVLNKALLYDQVDLSNESKLTSFALEDRMEHPVYAFVATNRLVKALNQVDQILEEIDDTKYESSFQQNVILELNHLKENYSLPSPDDLIGCGEALLRLQFFYNLNIDDIIYGNLVHYKNKSSKFPLLGKGVFKKPLMESNDCFELGKVAYTSGRFKASIAWFQKAIDLSRESTTEKSDTVQILEYMAFAAYNLDSLKYAAQLTQLWLEQDPENERALKNLDYYLEELEQKQFKSNKLLGDDGENKVKTKMRTSETTEGSENTSNLYSTGTTFSAANYVVEKDKVVRNLCNRKTQLLPTGTCWKNETAGWPFACPELRFENLYSDPDIIRIYDILTNREADHLRHLAASRLERSTVQTKSGLVTTDFRIAKTAWLPKQIDLIVDRVEQRLSKILDFDLDSSEHLQVVNYGIGGFYGPHLDSARPTASENYTSSGANFLSANDRLATILIYLNRIEAGGATVFPKLNLSVQPVKNSAVIWFNLLRDGNTDDRTLHTGCPVLLGSKWIATKWPKEKPNIFLRPCGRKLQYN